MATVINRALECVVNTMHTSPHKFSGKHEVLINLCDALVQPILLKNETIGFEKWAHLMVHPGLSACETFQLLIHRPEAPSISLETIAKCAPILESTWTDRVNLQMVEETSYFEMLYFIRDHPSSLVEMKEALLSHVRRNKDKEIHSLINVLESVYLNTTTDIVSLIEHVYHRIDDVYNSISASCHILFRTMSPTFRPPLDDVIELLGEGSVELAQYFYTSGRTREISGECMSTFQDSSYLLLLEARGELHKLLDTQHMLQMIQPNAIFAGNQWEYMILADLIDTNVRLYAEKIRHELVSSGHVSFKALIPL